MNRRRSTYVEAPTVGTAVQVTGLVVIVAMLAVAAAFLLVNLAIKTR